LLANSAWDFEPHELARRAGIRTIIYERRIWNAGSRAWEPYTGKNPHTDHIHFGFSRAGGAGQTSLYHYLDRGGSLVPLPDRGRVRRGARGLQPTTEKMNGPPPVSILRNRGSRQNSSRARGTC
jgi:hypothetical protein